MRTLLTIILIPIMSVPILLVQQTEIIFAIAEPLQNRDKQYPAGGFDEHLQLDFDTSQLHVTGVTNHSQQLLSDPRYIILP